jgi:hypothetical protein
MSKFENVLKAQKVKRRSSRALSFFFSRRCYLAGFLLLLLLFCSESARAVFFGGSLVHIFLSRGTIRFRASLTRSLSFLFSTTHTHTKQQFYQQQHKHVHLKGTTDMISSVAIPLAMTASAFGMLAMGLKDLATGSNKKPGF